MGLILDARGSANLLQDLQDLLGSMPMLGRTSQIH